MSRNVERAKLSSEYKSDDRFSSIYIDLLSERLGGRAIACSDEWFAGAENMLKPGRGVFKEGLFVSTGKWMDGWESRRSFGRTIGLDREKILIGVFSEWDLKAY